MMKSRTGFLLFASLGLLFSCANKTPKIFEQEEIAGYDHLSQAAATMDSSKQTAVISYGTQFSSEPAKVEHSEARKTSRVAKDSLGVGHTYENRYEYYKVALSEEEGKTLFPLLREQIPSSVKEGELVGILLCECSKYYDGKIRSSVTVAKPIEYYLCVDFGGGDFYNGNSLGDLEPERG